MQHPKEIMWIDLPKVALAKDVDGPRIKTLVQGSDIMWKIIGTACHALRLLPVFIILANMPVCCNGRKTSLKNIMGNDYYDLICCLFYTCMEQNKRHLIS